MQHIRISYYSLYREIHWREQIVSTPPINRSLFRDVATASLFAF